MDFLNRILYFLLFLLLFTSCQNNSKSEIVSKEEIDPLFHVCDTLSALFSMNSLGFEDFSPYCDTLWFEAAHAVISRKQSEENFKEIRLNVQAVDSMSHMKIKEKLLDNFFGTGHDCQEKFCSFYGKTENNIDFETVFMDETWVRGKPYLAFRILEKDGIAE